MGFRPLPGTAPSACLPTPSLRAWPAPAYHDRPVSTRHVNIHPPIALLAALTLLAACEGAPGPPPTPAPPGVISFAVFGDGPYSRSEERRVATLFRDLEAVHPLFLLHVGDILGSPCTDEAYTARRAALEGLDIPVVYTPGDNEWTDCWANGYDPLERLTRLRDVFFEGPWAVRTRDRLRVVTQADLEPGAPFVENVRFDVGSVVFATAHIVGSRNGEQSFRGRSDAHDRHVRERTAAALRWIAAAFDRARERSAPLVVIAFHGDPYFQLPPAERGAFEPVVSLLTEQASAFEGRVLIVHGDSHVQRFDRPLVDPATGQVLENVQRLEAWGSPQMGWVHVLVDTAAADAVRVRPYLCPGANPFLVRLGLRREPEHCHPTFPLRPGL